MNSEKICFVVQRYGLEVNGGAELHCRQLAEHMKSYFNHIDVLTTKAIDYMTWKNEYTEDETYINGVHVIRFQVDRERNQSRFDEINLRFMLGKLKLSEEKKWVDEQGPYAPKLIDYLKKNKDEYKAFIFFTYLYYQTVIGVEVVADRAIVIPTAHDEPFLKMYIYRNVFMLPRAFLFNTEEERTLIYQKFHNEQIANDLGGVGVEIPVKLHPELFKEKYDLNNYVVYVGRVDEGKNCHQLFEYYLEYKMRNNNDLKLVLMGNPVIPIPLHSNIISLGFVSDEDKFNGIAGAQILILPSKYESLSMVVLEAMSIGTPVIVNGECPVLKAHCIKSNGAFYYNNFFEFEGEINYLREHSDIISVMKKNALKYVKENYQWDVITQRLFNLIQKIV